MPNPFRVRANKCNYVLASGSGIRRRGCRGKNFPNRHRAADGCQQGGSFGRIRGIELGGRCRVWHAVEGVTPAHDRMWSTVSDRGRRHQAGRGHDEGFLSMSIAGVYFHNLGATIVDSCGWYQRGMARRMHLGQTYESAQDDGIRCSPSGRGGHDVKHSGRGASSTVMVSRDMMRATVGHCDRTDSHV